MFALATHGTYNMGWAVLPHHAFYSPKFTSRSWNMRQQLIRLPSGLGWPTHVQYVVQVSSALLPDVIQNLCNDTLEYWLSCRHHVLSIVGCIQT